MIRIVVACLSVSFASFCLAQSDTVFIRYDKLLNDTIDYKTDTMLFKNRVSKNMVFETARLGNTKNQLLLSTYSLVFDEVENLGCVSETSKNYNSIIDSFYLTDTSLMAAVRLSENCCYSFLCDAGVEGDSIINLITHEYSTNYCGCICSFELRYYFSIGKNGRSEDFKGVKWLMLNSDKKTLTRIK